VLLYDDNRKTLIPKVQQQQRPPQQNKTVNNANNENANSTNDNGDTNQRNSDYWDRDGIERALIEVEQQQQQENDKYSNDAVAAQDVSSSATLNSGDEGASATIPYAVARIGNREYYSVECSECRTQVAALDMNDEIYHFFDCLESSTSSSTIL